MYSSIYPCTRPRAPLKMCVRPLTTDINRNVRLVMLQAEVRNFCSDSLTLIATIHSISQISRIGHFWMNGPYTRDTRHAPEQISVSGSNTKWNAAQTLESSRLMGTFSPAWHSLTRSDFVVSRPIYNSFRQELLERLSVLLVSGYTCLAIGINGCWGGAIRNISYIDKFYHRDGFAVTI